MIRRQFTYYGNSWIGMFIRSNNSITLIPVDSLDIVKKTTAHFLKTKVFATSIAQSNLIGVYVAMNDNGIILPNVVTEEEIDFIKSIMKESGANVYVSKEKHNSHGNNIAVNNKGGIINPDISASERKKMEEVLGVELTPTKIAAYSTVGSNCIVSDRGFLINYTASEDELKFLEKIFKVKGERGTMNTGSGFVGYGAIANAKGYVAGEASTAFELGQLVNAMDFVDDS